MLIFLIYNTSPHIFYVHASYVNFEGIRGDFTIENDTTKTNNENITLNLDVTGATQMRFGNIPSARDAASWESYASTKAWTLSSGEGKKTVYGAFQNAGGDIIFIEDDIIFQNIPNLPFTGGLTLWLDGKDSSSITESSGNISAWDDKSGNAYHAKQNTGTNQANLVGDEVDFNGTSDYFYLENLNYQNSSPLDGLLVCSVFRTTNTNTSLSGNWAFLDFDRSEWFNFYNRGGNIGFSYNAGGIQDVQTSGAAVNDNRPHVACASYDNSLTNDTVVTIDGTTRFSANREANGSQIGVGRSRRYGFVGDGSEAATENAGRNNAYYDGGIYEMVYYDTAVSSANRKDIECYLGEKWGVAVSGCPADTLTPIASVSYSPESTTSSNVIATLEKESESITITNNGGSNTYTFTSNGTFNFEYEDGSGNTGSTLARVDWIDPAAPPVVGTGGVNEAPTLTSYSGASVVTLAVGSGATDVADIDAIDSVYNIVGEYGTSSLSGNAWQNILHNEMCNPIAVASHRQLVNAEIQRAPRIRNKTGTGFEIKVDNYNSTIGGISTNIDYIVMEAGVYNFAGGLGIQAASQNTSAVACNSSNSPTPAAVTFSPAFSAPPVVIHTISTENDATWVVSGVNGNSGNRGSEPSISSMGTILQRSFNSCTHAAEDVDYIAFTPGNYTLSDGTKLDTTRSTDSIASVTASGNPISFSSPFSSAPQTVLVSQLGEDGGNGGYAQIHNGGGVTNSQVFATIDEDGPSADRNHTSEVASSVAFDKSSGQFWKENTLSYAISGGADSTEFSINTTNGDLDFISGKAAGSTADANGDGIYEVTVQVCDSHCNSKCVSQTIRADLGDTTPPDITSISPGSGSLLPGGNHSFQINYFDAESGIDTGSDTISLQKWDGVSAWGSDISATGLSLGSKTITSTGASYNSNNLSYGKYRINFSISDLAGNSSSIESEFYIDEPEFTVSTPSIDIGNLNVGTSSFSSSVTLTVKTVGAGFRINMKPNTDPLSGSESIDIWNGSTGYGYEKAPFTGGLNAINTNQLIVSQSGSINTNGAKNTYTYDIKLGALTDMSQIAGDYEGLIDFGIELDY